MSKPIVLSVKRWKEIRADLHEHYPRSVMTLRNKMRVVLGFTVREHNMWVRHTQYTSDGEEYDMGHHETMIHLDFFDERKRTLFLLRYNLE